MHQSGNKKVIEASNTMSGLYGYEVISDTAAHTGLWGPILCVTETVFALLTADSSAPVTGTPTAITYVAGTIVYGLYTAITLTSGDIHAFNTAQSLYPTTVTVSSTTYTVAESDGTNGTIIDVPTGTSKTEFVAALTEDDSSQSWNIDDLNDVVVDTDTLVVTAGDGVTQMTYVLTVGSLIATVSSTEYTVEESDASNGTIIDVLDETTKADFLANLTKDYAVQTWDSASVNEPVVSTDELVVTSESGIDEITYVITVDPSHIATISSATYTIAESDASTGTIIDIPIGTLKAAFEAAMTKDDAGQTWDTTNISATVATDDTMTSTAEDTSTIVTYVISVNTQII